jgi:hypothetical protein
VRDDTLSGKRDCDNTTRELSVGMAPKQLTAAAVAQLWKNGISPRPAATRTCCCTRRSWQPFRMI